MAYTAITSEGGLLPADLLDRVATGTVAGQRPEDFGLRPGQRLADEVQSAFSDVRAYWEAFQRRLAHAHESLGALTRRAWVEPLLERLGYTLVRQRAAVHVDGASYVLIYRAGDDLDAPPVHVVALDQRLDRRGDGAARSPHATVQEYLNRSDALWGLVTNGERLRLLRDSARLARPTFLEFDLRAIVEGNLYSEFVLLYRLLHRTRLPRTSADAPQCWLERYYQQGLDEGGRVRERLREGVERALVVLGTAFLRHPASEALREALAAGRLDAAGYYRQLLRLVYRLLFLFVVEERRLLLPPDAPHAARQTIYARYYSASRLRDRCERPGGDDRHGDLWQGLLQTFALLRDDTRAPLLGLAALDGELFGEAACRDLEQAGCDNASLLRAVFHLSTFVEDGVRRRVNYAALDVEELGSIYESLLDYRPAITAPAPEHRLPNTEHRLWQFHLAAGGERKQTGSYYTPPDLVRELIDHALVPVMDERLKGARTPAERERALLGLRICDPAAGSGHFLLAAARRIGRELARARTGEDEPPPEAYRAAVRDVIRQCLYAVDRNPLAVDLCKVALWLESHSPGLPLSFLDHHVKCGDSLVGVADLRVLVDGVPDDAYTPVTGDDRKAAAAYKKRNRAERAGQLPLAPHTAAPGGLAPDFAALAALDERTPADVQAKEALYAALRARGGHWYDLKVACDLWTAAFFTPLQPVRAGPDLVPTTGTVREYLARPGAAHGQVVGHAVALAEEHRFFHWPLEFPEVFAVGGFDVVLGNPPWERIKLQEREFFAERDEEIAKAPNKAARQCLIDALPERKPALAAEFAAAKHAAEAQSRFVRQSGRFPLTAVGDVNYYALFAEQGRVLLGPRGWMGMVLPPASPPTTQRRASSRRWPTPAPWQPSSTSRTAACSSRPSTPGTSSAC